MATTLQELARARQQLRAAWRQIERLTAQVADLKTMAKADRYRLTEGERRAAGELRRRGVSVIEIAELLRVSRQAIYDATREE